MTYEEMVEYMDLMHTLETEGGHMKGCEHSWKKYEGFTDVYEYCVHCDVKKGTNK